MPYLNVTEVESALATAAGPPNTSFTQLLSLPHLTWEGRQCHAIRIGSSAPGRVGVYFIGGIHAREWGSPDILIFFIEQLTQAYRTHKGVTLGGKTFTATQIQQIVNKLDIIVFPQVNPDGRNYSITADSMWRKNRRPAPSSHTGCPGVDINRNFDFLWHFPDFFDPNSPVSNSTDPCDYQVYIGPGSASEPETKNVVWVLDNFPNTRLMVDVHSYGEKILCNWGDDDNQTTNPSMNFMNAAYNGMRGNAGDSAYGEFIADFDQALDMDLSNRLRDAIQAVRGHAYTVEPSFNLYPTAGTSTDYAFSRCFTDPGKGKVHSLTIEWGNENNPTPFHPPYSEMQHIIQEVTAGLLDLCLGITELNADVYIKDNVDDTGMAPYSGCFWDNSDIVVRQSDDDVFAFQPAASGQDNYIYIKVINLSPSLARRVRVTARAVRYPGTELVYPYDWRAMDATHIVPSPIIDTFDDIPAGDFRIAKFRLSASQVDALWNWQLGGMHACLIAMADGCNDFCPPTGVHVWENNNLAQRNVTVVPALQNQVVNFPFMAGHKLNEKESMHLAIDRTELPRDVELLLDPSAPDNYFPAAYTKAAVNTKETETIHKLTFLDKTRIQVNVGNFRGKLTLAPGSIFEYGGPSSKKAILSVQGGELVQREGRSIVALHERKTEVKFQKTPGQLCQAMLRFKVPEPAKPGEIYRIRVTQQDHQGKVTGGVTLEVHVQPGNVYNL